jgi:superfamily I DNA/RNA helicase
VVARYYNTRHFYINNFTALDRIKLLLLLEGVPVPMSAPDFNIRLEGELLTSSLPDAFYSQAGFMESLGLEVTQVVENISFRERGVEYYFCAALRIFWPHFEKFLSNFDPKLMTFNRAFLLLARNSEVARHALTPHHLRPLTHVLVDEFQDISPQIASWLKACQKKLAVVGRSPTIMAIGDDWQSIYGWRGSAPDFFIQFDEHFPVHKDAAPACRLEMAENFRSNKPIVEDAQKLLALVRNKVEKRVRAIKVAAAGEHGVVLRVEDMKKSLDAHAAFILGCLRQARKGAGDKNLVIVLCRTNKVLEELEDAVREKASRTPGLAFYTFHSAKGLQGETAIIFEDSKYTSSHLLRNIIYEQAKTEHGERIFRQSYDQAMTDEAYRLAYVAVTRGMKRVYWFVEAQEHASKVFEPEPAKAEASPN